jgi:hypothetical protein
VASRAELIEAVARIRKGAGDDADLEADVALFLGHAARPDAERLFEDRSLAPELVVAVALDCETFEVEGMTIPLFPADDGTRWLWFLDPRRTALHWVGTFREVIERGEEFANQGFVVHRTPDPELLEQGRARWREWTGRELEGELYVLAPAWGRPGRDEPIVAPASFLRALLAEVERRRIRLPGGAFGRAAP